MLQLLLQLLLLLLLRCDGEQKNATEHRAHALHARPTTGFYAMSSTFPNRSIVIDSRWFGDPPGGVEALIQLSIAMVAASSPDSVYVSGYNGLKYHDKWVRAYGDKLVRQVKRIAELRAGDIFIINEAIECPQVSPGVLVYAYLLANYRGCRGDSIHYISHNHNLLKFENLVLPRERMIQPYMSQNIISMAHQRGLQHDGSILYSKLSHKAKKRNLVLVDDDVPEAVKRLLKKVTEALGGKVQTLTAMTLDQIVEAYESAMIATDWCMRGSERCMYEASLFGTVVITNKCETGSDFLDLPVPSRYIFNHTDDTNKQSDATNEALYNESFPGHIQLEADLTRVIDHVFSNYWDILDDFEPLRRTVLSHTPSSMMRESMRFLASVLDTPKDENEILMKKKCVGCRL